MRFILWCFVGSFSIFSLVSIVVCFETNTLRDDDSSYLKSDEKSNLFLNATNFSTPLNSDIEKMINYRHYIYINPSNLEERIPALIQFVHVEFYKSNEIIRYYHYDTISELLSGYDKELHELFLEINPIHASLLSDIGRLLILYLFGGVYHDLKMVSDNEIVPFLRQQYLNEKYLILEKHPVMTDKDRFRLTSMVSLKPRHPFLHDVLQDLKERLKETKKNGLGGPFTILQLALGIVKAHYQNEKENSNIKESKSGIIILSLRKFIVLCDEIYDMRISKWQETFDPVFCDYQSKKMLSPYCKGTDRIIDTISLLDDKIERLLKLRHYLYLNPYKIDEVIPPTLLKYYTEFYTNNEIVLFHHYNHISKLIFKYDEELHEIFLKIDPIKYPHLIMDIGKLIILYHHGGVYQEIEFVSSIDIISFLKEKYSQGVTFIAEKDYEMIINRNLISLQKKHYLIHQTLQKMKEQLLYAYRHQHIGLFTEYNIGTGTLSDTLRLHRLISKTLPFLKDEIDTLDIVEGDYLLYNREVDDERNNHIKNFGSPYCIHSNETMSHCKRYSKEREGDAEGDVKGDTETEAAAEEEGAFTQIEKESISDSILLDEYKWNYIEDSEMIVTLYDENLSRIWETSPDTKVTVYNKMKEIDYSLPNSTSIIHSSVYFHPADRRKKVFLHIPKTGGTSMEDFLYKYNVSVGVRYKSWFFAPLYALNNTFIKFIKQMEKNELNYQCSPWHIPPIDYIPNSVAIVRDPIKRMISEFEFNIGSVSFREEGMHFNKSCESFNKWVPFVLNRYIEFPSLYDCHLIPQWHFAKHVSQIYSFEDFKLSGDENLFSKVASYFNLNSIDETSHEYKRIQNYSNNYFDCISPENIKCIKEFYYEDYENLLEYF